jgi:hypothetical protein
MCFNPAKSWQLGWYETQQIAWNPLEQGALEASLVGVSDFGSNETTTSHFVVVRIENGAKDLFIGYNRAKSFNWDTRMSKDKVVIVEQGEGFSESTQLAALSAGEELVIERYLGSHVNLVIRFKSASANLDVARIEIFLPGVRI